MSDETRLASINTALDAIYTALETGKAFVEYEINGVRVKKTPTLQMARELEALAGHYQRRVTGRRSGVVAFRRRH